jgi:hypothetical protein
MSELPDDLADLERRLAAARPQPDAALRQRVLASVQDELRREAGASTNEFWRFAAALAATVLLGAYLSMSAALNVGWQQSGNDGGDIAAATKRLQQLDPNMTEQEARRQVLMLQMRAHISAAPALSPTLDRLLHERELLPREPR